MTGDAVPRETKATVTRETPRGFVAWCEPCGDGIRSHRRIKADEWAATHNRHKHEEKKNE